MINLVDRCDVLIIECALANDNLKRKGHLTPNEVIKVIQEAKPKKAVVTHFYPECDKENVVETIRDNVEIEVVEAQDLLEIEI